MSSARTSASTAFATSTMLAMEVRTTVTAAACELDYHSAHSPSVDSHQLFARY